MKERSVERRIRNSSRKDASYSPTFPQSLLKRKEKREATVRLGHKRLRTLMKRSSSWYLPGARERQLTTKIRAPGQDTKDLFIVWLCARARATGERRHQHTFPSFPTLAAASGPGFAWRPGKGRVCWCHLGWALRPRAQPDTR